MQSVSSGAVYNALGSFSRLNMASLPTDANTAGVDGKVSAFFGQASLSSLSNYPSISANSAGGIPVWFLYDMCQSGREVQTLYVSYFDGTDWRNGQTFTRGRIDSTWFAWKELYNGIPY